MTRLFKPTLGGRDVLRERWRVWGRFGQGQGVQSGAQVVGVDRLQSVQKTLGLVETPLANCRTCQGHANLGVLRRQEPCVTQGLFSARLFALPTMACEQQSPAPPGASMVGRKPAKSTPLPNRIVEEGQGFEDLSQQSPRRSPGGIRHHQ